MLELRMAVLAVAAHQLEVLGGEVGILAEEQNGGRVEVGELAVDVLHHTGAEGDGAVDGAWLTLVQLVQGAAEAVVAEVFGEDVLSEGDAGGGVLVELGDAVQWGAAGEDIEDEDEDEDEDEEDEGLDAPAGERRQRVGSHWTM